MSTESTERRSKTEPEDSPVKLDLLEELGGPQGVADSSIPSLVFVIVYTLAGNRIGVASICALAVGVVIAILRLLKGEPLRFALSGLLGVAIAAFFASRTGRAEDFFLPGLLFNLAYAAAFLVSILVRWPLLGVILGPALGEGRAAWRGEPQLLRTYSRASWIWVGVFASRLAVQLPFYLAGSLIALGIAKTAMGLPVFALGVWLSYLVLKQGGVITTWRGIFATRPS
ncbi:MAG TPA: DUF3159 domain-containing protein [Solirubrobacterales bacterium]|jgi:hypothetical protein